MTRAPAEAKQSLSTDERRRVQHNLDRIEDRLRDAPDGLHAFNPPADPAELAASPLPPAARMLWAQWDGLELAAGELRLWPLAELAQADVVSCATWAEVDLGPQDLNMLKATDFEVIDHGPTIDVTYDCQRTPLTE